jgi:hypothetical protein
VHTSRGSLAGRSVLLHAPIENSIRNSPRIGLNRYILGFFQTNRIGGLAKRISWRLFLAFGMIEPIHDHWPAWIRGNAAVPTFAILGANIYSEDHGMSTVYFSQQSDQFTVLTLACPHCESPLQLHQPDPELADRLLATCDECKSWFLANSKANALTLLADDSGGDVRRLLVS